MAAWRKSEREADFLLQRRGSLGDSVAPISGPPGGAGPNGPEEGVTESTANLPCES